MSGVRILRLAAGGDGVGKLDDGRTVFVPRTAPGDLVEPVRSSRAQALRARPARPPDRAVARPGRAALSALRARRVRRLPAPAPRRPGAARGAARLRRRRAPPDRRVATWPIRRSCPRSAEFEYRTKITLAVSADGRRIGLHPLRSRRRGLRSRVVPHHRARADGALAGAPRGSRPLLPAAARGAGAADGARGRPARAVPDGRRRGLGRRRALHAELRRRNAAGDALVAARWRRAPRHGRARTRRTPRPCSSRCTPPWATGCAPTPCARLARSSGRHVWDLYAGIGETTAALARAGALGRERRVRPAGRGRGGEPGSRRAAARGSGGGRAARAEGPGPGDHQPAPHGHGRAGARARSSGWRRSGSSTCPATRRRWRATSAASRGFRSPSVRAFDLFPQTAHVETVVALERAS